MILQQSNNVRSLFTPFAFTDQLNNK